MVNKREELIQAYRNDPQLFIETYLKVQEKDTGRMVPFRLNVGQRYAFSAFQEMRSINKPVRVIILKARQLGMSTLACALQLWKAILYPRSTCFTVSLTKDESAGNLLDKIKTHYSELPPWLQPMIRYDTKSHIDFSNPNSKERLHNAGLQSKIYIESGTNPHACKSFTPTYVHMSEFAMWPQAESSLNSIMNAMPTEPETFAVIESTAFGASGKFYEMWQEANESATPTWRSVFIPFWVQEEYCVRNLSYNDEKNIFKTLTDYESQWMERYGLTTGQIAWARAKISEIGSLPKFLEDYAPNANDCFLLQGDTVFNKERIRELAFKIDNEYKPGLRGRLEREDNGKIRFVMDSRGAVTIYEVPDPSSLYVVGTDPCSEVGEALQQLTEAKRKQLGKGGAPDKLGIQVLKVRGKEYEQVAEVHGYIGPGEAAKQSIMLAEMYGWCMIMPESEGVGHALMKGLKKYPHLGYYERSDKIGLDINIHSRLGWSTNKKSIHLLQQGLLSAINEGRLKIRSKSFIKEMTTYIHKDGGGMKAAHGAHDDLLMAMALAIQGAEQTQKGNVAMSVYSPADEKAIWTPQGMFPVSIFANQEDYLTSRRSEAGSKSDNWMCQ